MKVIGRTGWAALAGVTAIVLSAGPSLAHECVNASKNQDAGVQVVIDANTGEVVWGFGVGKRVEQGLIDPNTGEGFHGLIGLDFDGDGIADVSTFIVGPEGEIPDTAQFSGPACRGVTYIGTYFAECLA